MIIKPHQDRIEKSDLRRACFRSFTDDRKNDISRFGGNTNPNATPLVTTLSSTFDMQKKLKIPKLLLQHRSLEEEQKVLE